MPPIIMTIPPPTEAGCMNFALEAVWFMAQVVLLTLRSELMDVNGWLRIANNRPLR
jgi:hypothetical protein